MGENSKIEWTDHTFNPWIGCTKVSPGCAHCYAERDMERYGKAKWGAGQPRVRTAASTWAQPLKWDRAAAKSGVRAKVFCASLADVFDPEVPIEWLDNLFDLIDRCQHLDWLLLTKRPELIMRRVCDVFERHMDDGGRGPDFASCWIGGMPPPNVWIGTTVEDQQRANDRIPWLAKVPARIHFLSCEPLLGPVSLNLGSIQRSTIDWIICGGESGPFARPMRPDWARSLRDQAQAAGVPFLFKQWGEWAPGECADGIPKRTEETAEWSDPVWIYDWLTPSQHDGLHVNDEPDLYRLGKVRAGRCLDGRTHDERPYLANTVLDGSARPQQCGGGDAV